MQNELESAWLLTLVQYLGRRFRRFRRFRDFGDFRKLVSEHSVRIQTARDFRTEYAIHLPVSDIAFRRPSRSVAISEAMVLVFPSKKSQFLISPPRVLIIVRRSFLLAGCRHVTLVALSLHIQHRSLTRSRPPQCRRAWTPPAASLPRA